MVSIRPNEHGATLPAGLAMTRTEIFRSKVAEIYRLLVPQFNCGTNIYFMILILIMPVFIDPYSLTHSSA